MEHGGPKGEAQTSAPGVHEPHWARRVSRPSEAAFGGAERASLSMQYGMPDPALFPTEEVAAATQRALAGNVHSAVALQYGKIQGQPSLLSLLCAKLNEDERLGVQPENLIISNGSSGAIGLAVRALVDEGDTVLVEAPSFPGVLNILRGAGAVLHPLPMGTEGLNVAGAEAEINALHARGISPRVLYTMPTFHNPTGLTIPQARRGALLGLAGRHDLTIIEDDAYRDLYYDAACGPLPSSLYALDREARVIRTGTFSKILAPGLRLGWAIAQPEVIRRMLQIKEEGGTNPFAQQVVAEYIRGGSLMPHIETLVDAYRLKREAMLGALDRHFPPEAEWTRPAGGFFVWVTLPPSVEPAQLDAMARREGVDYLPGEQCFCAPDERGTHLRLSFSTLGLDDIEEAIKRLGRVVESLL